MNSIHRVGVTVAGLATVATIAGAFVAQGYLSAQQTAAQASAQAAALVAAAATATDTPQPPATPDPTADPTASVSPQIIYVNPAPTPKTVHTAPRQPQRPAATRKPAPAPTPPVITVIVPTPGGENGGHDD